MRIPPLSLLSNTLRAAARAGDAVGGNIQVVSGDTLHILVHFGLSSEFIEHFAHVTAEDGSACGQALRDRRRIVIRDIEGDEGFAEHLAVTRAAGVRAVQSTPLLDTHHKLIGVLSTHFAAPHYPPPAELTTIDACAEAAARLLEIHRMERAISAADNTHGMAARVLAPAAAQAATEASLLLERAAHSTDRRAMVETATRHLDVIIEELAELIARYSTARLADPADFLRDITSDVH